MEEGDEDEEGFVVGDGYLSDDEGMREMDDDGEREGEGIPQDRVGRLGTCFPCPGLAFG